MQTQLFEGGLIRLTNFDPEKDAEREYSGLAAYQFRPRVSAIDAALEAEYQHRSDTTEAVKQAQEYNADQITEKYWKRKFSYTG